MISPLFLSSGGGSSLLLLIGYTLLVRSHDQHQHWPPTCSLLCLHDGCNVLLVGGLLGTSLGVLVLLSGESTLSLPVQYFTTWTYDVAQLLLGSLTGVLTLVTTGHLGLKGLRNYLKGEKK